MLLLSLSYRLIPDHFFSRMFSTQLLIQFTTLLWMEENQRSTNWPFYRRFCIGPSHRKDNFCIRGISKCTLRWTFWILSKIWFAKGKFSLTCQNFSLTLALDQVSPISTPIGEPENSETHEDLSYVFEQSDYQDPEEDVPDLKLPEPFFFHQTATEIEQETLDATVKLVHV
jgi:hypothetical protein